MMAQGLATTSVSVRWARDGCEDLSTEPPEESWAVRGPVGPESGSSTPHAQRSNPSGEDPEERLERERSRTRDAKGKGEALQSCLGGGRVARDHRFICNLWCLVWFVVLLFFLPGGHGLWTSGVVNLLYLSCVRMS